MLPESGTSILQLPLGVQVEGAEIVVTGKLSSGDRQGFVIGRFSGGGEFSALRLLCGHTISQFGYVAERQRWITGYEFAAPDWAIVNGWLAFRTVAERSEHHRAWKGRR
jgi:hypothetical protein